MVPGDLLSAFPHRQFHTLPGLLDIWAALSNSYPNALRATQGGSLYHFYDGLWYDLAERLTHDLPCERRTRYRLSQPDTVSLVITHAQVCVPYVTTATSINVLMTLLPTIRRFSYRVFFVSRRFFSHPVADLFIFIGVLSGVS